MQPAAMIVTYVLIAAFGTMAFRARAKGEIHLGMDIRHGAFREFAIGLTITTIAMTGIFGTEWLLGAIRIDGAGPDVALLLGTLAVLLVLAAFEELAFRVLLLTGLLAVTHRAWIAIAGSSLLFALGHLFNPGAGPLTVLSALLGGVMYGLAFVFSGRVWLPLGMHLAWNFVQGPVLGFPVSGTTFSTGAVVRQTATGPDWITGGVYGPEGGVVGIAFRLVTIALVVAFVHRRASQP